MGRVHGLRGDQRKNVEQVIVPHLLALGLGQPGVTAQVNPLLLEQFVQFGGQLPLLLRDLAHHRQALAELLFGAASVHGQLAHPRPDLLFEAADALHEKLVQIGADDGQKLDPLQ